MFKKLVTNLPYSPGLLNQIGFYSKRLSQEEFTRRIGVIFTILAMILNINLVYFGPEASVLASPGNDVVSGGIYGSSAAEIQEKAIAAYRNSDTTKAIFDYYGITEADILNTTLTTINTADPNLRSVGRQSFGRGGETCKTYQGVYFCERSIYAAYSYRSLDVRAITGLRSGSIGNSDPYFSLIESCGNVVIRINGDEDITASKVVQNGVQSADVGDEVTFRLRITSQNDNGAANPVISDTLPAHMEYVSHFPDDVYDRASVNDGVLTLSSSRDRYAIGPHETWAIDITMRVLSTAPSGAKLCNTAKVESLGDTALTTSDACITIEQEAPQPDCVALRLLSGGGDDKRRTFEAQVDADGATIERYVFNFGDGTSKTVISSDDSAQVAHDYANSGSYDVAVTVATSAGEVGGDGVCAKRINIDEPVTTEGSTLNCSYLNVLSVNDRTYGFEAVGEADGRTISTFEFDFGDGSSASAASDNDRATIEHTYGEPGEYAVTVNVVDSEGTTVTSASCQLSIEIEAEICPYDDTLLVSSPDCQQTQGVPDIIKRKLASNLTQNIDDAHGTTAQAGDVIEYRLITENDGDGEMADYVIKESFGDVLQYANIVDLDGATLNEDSYVLSWPAETIAAGATVTKTVSVRIKSPIPQTPVSLSDSRAYDLMIENVYGNNVTVKLPTSPAKAVESVSRELPNTGPGANMIVSTMFVGMVSYFYFRNRLIAKELKMIRNEFSGAGL